MNPWLDWKQQDEFDYSTNHREETWAHLAYADSRLFQLTGDVGIINQF